MPLPVEVKFADNAFTIGKCNPVGADSPIDAECNDGTVPHAKTFKLAVKITLMDDILNDKTEYVFTDGAILDPCEVDEVHFTEVALGFDYLIKNTAEAMLYDPKFERTRSRAQP